MHVTKCCKSNYKIKLHCMHHAFYGESTRKEKQKHPILVVLKPSTMRRLGLLMLFAFITIWWYILLRRKALVDYAIRRRLHPLRRGFCYLKITCENPPSSLLLAKPSFKNKHHCWSFEVLKNLVQLNHSWL